jgi:hypothetical protein
MNFFSSTSAWIKGEIFEGILILLFGITIILSGFLFWKFGTTANAKALVMPLILAGIVYAALGGSMYVSNQKRMPAYQQKFGQNQLEFIQSEKKRVEDFQYMYTISKMVATVFFLVTLLIFWLSKNPTWQGWGIGITIFAISGLVVDYFSQERSAIYYKTILEALK